MLIAGLFLADVFTDVALGIELILNEFHEWGYLVLSLVILPNAVALAAEVLRACIYGGFCCLCCCCLSPHDFAKPSNWIPLFAYHIYTLFMLSVGRFRARWRHLSVYLRSIQGFFQAGPQLVLQIIILAKGVHIHSLHQSLQWLSDNEMDLFSERGFFRFYLAGQNLRWFWGLIQVYTVVLSFVSVLQTSVQFNEWEKRRHTLHRMLLVVPFFAVTILYRSFAIAFLICMAGIKLAALPLSALALAQGADLLGPSGYSRGRDPHEQPFGLALIKKQQVEERIRHSRMSLDTDPDKSDGCCGGGPGEGRDEEHYWVGDRSPQQVNALRERTRFYLAMHVIFGGGILGICLTIVGFMLNFTRFYPVGLSGGIGDYIYLSLTQINDCVFPGIAILFLTAVILTRTFSCCIGRCFEEEYIYPI